jgi:CRISPR-associated protein Csd2
MFDHDRSASRGKMSAQKLIVFEHDSRLGNAPAHKLFKLVQVRRKPEVDIPRAFEDYEVEIFPASEGVRILEKL